MCQKFFQQTAGSNFQFFMKTTSKNQPPVYYLSEAAEVAYANISDTLKRKYNLQTIRYILALEDDYFDIIGINHYYHQENPTAEKEPIEVNEKEMCEYIIKRATENNLYFEKEEISEVLHAELIYLKMIGVCSGF